MGCPKKILSDEQLEGMLQHKYASTGKTFTDPCMQPFWNKIVTFMPLWLAPNLITIIGLSLNAFSSILLFIYFPEASSERYDDNTSWALRSLFLLNGVTLFLYNTLDNIDGKQARRTKSSSPLGELFDHGMDAISCALVGNASLICMNSGKEPWLFIAMSWITFSTYYLYHWKTSLTDKLEFAYFDVDEFTFVSILGFMASFILGPEIWDTNIPIFSDFYFPIRYVVYLTMILAYIKVVILFVVTLFQHETNVAGGSVLEAGQPFLILLVLCAFSLLLDWKNDPSLQIIAHHQILYSSIYGLTVSKLSSKLILAHMSHTNVACLDFSHIWMTLVVLFQIIGLGNITTWLTIIAFGIALDNVWYLTNCYKEIASYFGIQIFKIVPQSDLEDQ